MNPRIKNYLISFSITSIILIVLAILTFFLFPELYFFWFPLIFLIAAGIHGILHIALIKKIDASPKKFVNHFMLMTTIKIFTFLFGLLITFYLFTFMALQIGITVLIIFFAFLILEVKILLKNFKK